MDMTTVGKANVLFKKAILKIMTQTLEEAS